MPSVSFTRPSISIQLRPFIFFSLPPFRLHHLSISHSQFGSILIVSFKRQKHFSTTPSSPSYWSIKPSPPLNQILEACRVEEDNIRSQKHHLSKPGQITNLDCTELPSMQITKRYFYELPSITNLLQIVSSLLNN
ncbi:unnamed protein product [Cuscuta europaea]|uniref:Uncharacterized protein n=1 Tax=Cuscuta europaea TaxID=41803 RepID=A0A9P0ZGN9_CUSEU|nr:unnamed protein product [Cuscuta europaea]